MSDTATETVIQPTLAPTGDGEHDRFAHWVHREAIVEAAVLGTPTTALCGKTWVPLRDGSKYPVCPTCKEIYDSRR